MKPINLDEMKQLDEELQRVGKQLVCLSAEPYSAHMRAVIAVDCSDECHDNWKWVAWSFNASTGGLFYGHRGEGSTVPANVLAAYRRKARLCKTR